MKRKNKFSDWPPFDMTQMRKEVEEIEKQHKIQEEKWFGKNYSIEPIIGLGIIMLFVALYLHTQDKELSFLEIYGRSSKEVLFYGGLGLTFIGGFSLTAAYICMALGVAGLIASLFFSFSYLLHSLLLIGGGLLLKVLAYRYERKNFMHQKDAYERERAEEDSNFYHPEVEKEKIKKSRSFRKNFIWICFLLFVLAIYFFFSKMLVVHL